MPTLQEYILFVILSGLYKYCIIQQLLKLLTNRVIITELIIFNTEIKCIFYTHYNFITTESLYYTHLYIARA